MGLMPRPPFGDSPDHEQSAEALQKWLWNCAAAGWQLTPDSNAWGHDDNMAVQHLGWMIAQPPGSKYYDLFVLRRGMVPHKTMDTIVDMSAVDPSCAKAVAMLTKQRLLFPNVKFAFMGEKR